MGNWAVRRVITAARRVSFLQHTAKQGHTAGLQTKGLHGGGSHLGQFISGMGNNGLRRGIALLQGRVQQGGQGGNFLLVVVGA